MSDSKSNEAPWLRTQTFLLLLAAAQLAAFPLVAIGLNTFFYRDFGAYCYPLTFFTAQCLHHGQLPLWDPYTHCGIPLMAQLGQWYPPTLLSLFLPMPWSTNFFHLLHLFWGGFGMFWLARRWNAGTFAASFAGMAYVFNGVTMSSLIWITYIAALAWLPWVVGCAQAAWRDGGRWLVLAAGAAALQVLAGMPEITALTWLLIAALWINALFIGETKLKPSILRLGGIILLAAGITMIQMLPFLDLLAHSQRNAHAASGEWSMPGWGWANLIVPLFHCYPSPQGTWFQHDQDLLPSYYLGAGVLAFAIFGALFTKGNFRAALILMVVLCWTMATGTHGFVYGWVHHLFPAIGFSRFPIKFAILPAFLVPLLAARGIDHLRNCSPASRHHLTIVLAGVTIAMGVLLGFAHQFPFALDRWDITAWNGFERALLMFVMALGVLFSFRSKNHAGGVLLQVVVLALLPFDALTHSPNIAPTLPTAYLTPGMWQASGKSAPPVPGDGRIMIHPDAEDRLLYSRVPGLTRDFTGKRIAEWYNFNLLDGIPKVTGPVPLQPNYSGMLENYIYYNSNGRCGTGLLDFLSVQWLSAPANPTVWQPRTSALPWISAGQRPVLADDKKTLAAITADDFNPRQTVYLPETTPVAVTSRTDSTVTNVYFGLDEVHADVDAAGPAVVVISQNYYHLWQAEVDGKPAPLLRANLAFQAVEVTAGQHHVRLVYHDPYLKIGAIVSLLSLVACAVLWRRSSRVTSATGKSLAPAKPGSAGVSPAH